MDASSRNVLSRRVRSHGGTIAVAFVWLSLVVLPAFLLGARVSHSTESVSIAMLGRRANQYMGACPPGLLAYVIFALSFGSPLALVLFRRVARAFGEGMAPDEIGLRFVRAIAFWILLVAGGGVVVGLGALAAGVPSPSAWSWTWRVCAFATVSGAAPVGVVLAIGSLSARATRTTLLSLVVLAMLGAWGVMDTRQLEHALAPGAFDRALFTGNAALVFRGMVGEALWLSGGIAVALTVRWLKRRSAGRAPANLPPTFPRTHGAPQP